MKSIDSYLPMLQDSLLQYGFNAVKAIAIFIVGRWIVKRLSNLLRKGLSASRADKMLGDFLGDIANIAMLAMVVIAAISQLGIQTASLVAVLGAAGLAIGLALQGSLSNFAAGVMIVVFRPYDVDDVVQLAGHSGKVEDLDIFTTTLRQGDRTKVIIPNGQALDGPIINYTEAGTRRVDLVVGVAYDTDIKSAREVILAAVVESELILPDPEPVIGVVELADSAVNLSIRSWVNSSDHYAASQELLERIKIALDEAGVGIPFPQRELHIVKSTEHANV